MFVGAIFAGTAHLLGIVSREHFMLARCCLQLQDLVYGSDFADVRTMLPSLLDRNKVSVMLCCWSISF